MGLSNQLFLLKRRIEEDEMARDSLIMVFFGLTAGLFNSLYQIVMGVMLTPAQYGTVFSLVSLSMIVVTVAQTFQTSAAKFTSRFKVRNNSSGIGYLLQFSLKRSLVLGTVLFVGLSVLSPFASEFLGMDSHWYLVALSLSFVLAFALPVSWGILGGLQRFVPLGLTTALLALLRLAIAVLLVYLGLGVYGGLLSIAAAYLVTFLVSLVFLRDVTRTGGERAQVSGLLSYTGVAFVAILAFSVVVNIDVLLAKHYFDADTAGNYSAISVLGRIAFYAPVGIATAMFPKASDVFESGGIPRRILWKGVAYTIFVAGGVVLVYWLFSGSIVPLVFGDKYPITADHLVRYGLAMLFFSLSFLLLNYCLSSKEAKSVIPVLLTVVLEVVLIALFHSSIAQIVNIMLACGAVSCVSLLPFCLKRGG